MNVFVTGGAGYIGSHVTRLLLAAGHRVRVFDDLSEGHAAAVPAECLVRGDLLDEAPLAKALRGGFDCAMHFAARCSVPESMADPEAYYRTNVVGSLRLLEAMRKAGCPRIVFSSSAATYGVPQKVPIAEDHPQAPINAYGQTKLDVENALKYFAAAYGLGACALRYFNAAGAAPDAAIGEDHDPETHLVPIVLEVALGRRQAVEVFGTDYPTRDGTCVRDYIHVDDLARAHILAMEAIEPGRGRLYNLGNGAGYTVREVIETARRVTGRAIASVDAPPRPGDPPQLVASSDRIARDLGWKPQFGDLETIVETAWRWHRSHPDGYGD
jgi:UDP-glucose 4-epimerase